MAVGVDQFIRRVTVDWCIRPWMLAAACRMHKRGQPRSGFQPSVFFRLMLDEMTFQTHGNCFSMVPIWCFTGDNVVIAHRCLNTHSADTQSRSRQPG